MENNTKYHFLGVEYNDYKELALALANNYADAINYIYTKEFTDQFTDTYLKGRLIAEQERSYYATSCLACTIYILNPELGLVLNGKSLRTYKDVSNALDDPNLRETCIHLFKDHSISHTIGQVDKSIAEIFEVENNIDDLGVVYYFQLFFDERFNENDCHGYKALDYYLFEAMQDKDPFKKYQELVYKPEFKGILGHRFSLRKILNWYDSYSVEYTIIANLLENINRDISPIIESGIHNYIFTTKKYLKNYKITKCLKKVKSYARKARKISKKADNSYVANSIYFDLYKFICRGYDLDLIQVKEDIYDLKYSYGCGLSSIDYLNKLADKNEYSEHQKEVLSQEERKEQIRELKKDIKLYKQEFLKNI